VPREKLVEQFCLGFFELFFAESLSVWDFLHLKGHLCARAEQMADLLVSGVLTKLLDEEFYELALVTFSTLWAWFFLLWLSLWPYQ